VFKNYSAVRTLLTSMRSFTKNLSQSSKPLTLDSTAIKVNQAIWYWICLSLSAGS
jgi:hypothetical protein